MTKAAQHGFASSILLVWLLLLAQWTGFAMVLCVAGPDHIQVECVDALGCAPRTTGKIGMSEDATGGCAGCTDIPIETASTWDPARRHPASTVPALAHAVSPDSLVPPARSCQTFDDSQSLRPFSSFTAAPLRC